MFAAGLITLTAAAQYAQAQTDGPQYAPTMLVLDASGSMQRPDAAGTMMDAAKDAVHSFVDSAPAESKVGLTTYGTGTGNTDAEMQAGCRDVRVLHQPDTLDKGALNGAVDGIEARGWTPMGPALRQAAETLPSSGPRSIVLVSDGEDTCAPPDACAVAQELKQKGIDLVVHAIGFAVDAPARAQLTCMAQSTGGTYTDAADGPALKRILPRVSAAALRNYQSAGTPITGTASYDKAPVATPGQYLDALGQHTPKYWAVDVPEGATAYFSGTVSFPRLAGIPSVDDNNVVQLRVFGSDGQDCHASDFEQKTSSSDGVALTVAKTWDGATKQRTGGRGDTCKGGGRYYFTLNWETVSAGVPEQLPLELLVGIEPAATDAGPVAALPKTEFTEPTGETTPVTGGGSFNSAATLAESGSYADAVRPGEFVFYRVRLDWGRGLAYRVHFAPNGSKGSDSVSNLTTTLYSPIRERINSDSGVYTGSDTALPVTNSTGTVPIRYHNRDAAPTETRKQAVAGWYYIAVKVGSTFTEKGDQSAVPVRLDLTVDGTKENGPTYATSNDGVFGENAKPKTPESATSAHEDPTVAGEHSSNSWILFTATGIGVLALVGIVVLVLIARKRRG
ncbi:vWA domain-containing protein [Nocardia callitridis]|uniref:vWA domain-containing protein n=1 Tax=Nocardia callitridis TaxID=648753 RepID=UPI0031ECAB5C